jgi:hypothetical protein
MSDDLFKAMHSEGPQPAPTERVTQVRIALVLATFVLLIISLFLGLVGQGDCGSPWSPNTDVSGLVSCQQTVSVGTLAAVLLAMAGACALTAALLWTREQPAARRAAAPAARVERPAPRSTTPMSEARVELTPDGPREVGS